MRIYAANSSGVYQYLPEQHTLTTIIAEDRRQSIALASGNTWASSAPLIIAIVWDDSHILTVDTTYVEVGLITQNVYLESTAWGLIADWGKADSDEEAMREALGLIGETHLHPASIITMGHSSIDVATADVGVCCGVSIVHGGFTARINTTVENQGENTKTFNVTAYWNTTHEIETIEVTLARGSNTTITFYWNTSGLAEYQNYTISAYVHPVLGETDLADNTFTYGIVTLVHQGDTNNDGKVRVDDILAIAMGFGKDYGQPGFDPNSDVNCDLRIRVDDMLATAPNFGWSS